MSTNTTTVTDVRKYEQKIVLAKSSLLFRRIIDFQIVIICIFLRILYFL